MKKTRILMTGATGFLGSHLLKRLVRSEYKIAICKRSFSNTSRIQSLLSKVEHFDLDKDTIEKIFSKARPDIIIHCATDYGRKDRHPLSVIETNLILPLKLLKEGVANGASCFINTDTILDKRISNYSLSKQQFKQWFKLYSDKLVCVNIALEHFYGPYDDRTKFVSYVLEELLSNAAQIDLTKGRQKRDFIYIDDVIDAFVTILSHLDKIPKGFHDFEIGTDKQMEIRQFVMLIKKLAGNKDTKLNFGALPYRKNEQMDPTIDTAAIRKLGWSPKYSVKEGIMKTIKIEKGAAEK
jgi:CDP-paratose synthetase